MRRPALSRTVALAAALSFAALAAAPAHAQHQGHGEHGGHDDHAGHGAAEPAPPPADPHAGHAGHGAPAPPAPPKADPPPPPGDHAADRHFDPAAMAAARARLARETGGMTVAKIMVDRLEYQARRGADAYHWDVEGWVGGDINRFAFRTEGEGERGGTLEQAEIHALYTRALDPWFNLQAGVRHDVRPRPQRSYAVLGVEGLAPCWFEVGASLFLSDKGDLHARAEASYDLRLTQRLIAQPAFELNLAAQDVPELGLGAGLTDVELGLRLRYEFVPEFAPYVGVSWERRIGDTARHARAAGETASSTAFVAGVRLWF